MEISQAKLESVRSVLLLLVKEYTAAGKSGPELREILDDELDVLARTADLADFERELLSVEFALSDCLGKHDEPDGPAPVKPFDTQHRAFTDGNAGTCETDAPRRLSLFRGPVNVLGIALDSPIAQCDALYRYDRAQAEKTFRREVKAWEERYGANPPYIVAKSDSITCVTNTRDALCIAESLAILVAQFIRDALAAHADNLLDAAIPAVAALKSFDDHAAQLLDDAFTNKWVASLRLLNISDQELCELARSRGITNSSFLGVNGFWAVQQKVVTWIRSDFEEILWDAELKLATSGANTRENVYGQPNAGPAAPDELPAEESTEELVNPNGRDRHAQVESFLLKCNQAGCGIIVKRKHIWLAVGHRTPRQFQYWQSGNRRATRADSRNFQRTLGTTPSDFVDQLKRQGHL